MSPDITIVNKPFKILYIAVHSHSGWGAEYWVERSFQEKGIKCINYDYRKKRKSFVPWFLINLELRSIEKNEKPDIVFLQRAENFPPSALMGISTPIVFWSTEPIQLKHDVDQLLKSNLFSWIFVHSYSCLERVKNDFMHNLHKCSIMHNACPSSIIETNTKKVRFAIFNRSMSLRRLTWLNRSAHMIDFISGRYGEEYFKDLSESSIAINVHYSDKNIDDCESGIFEAMAKGCVVISETLFHKAVNDLQIRNSYIEVSSPEQLKLKLQQLYSDPSILKIYRKRSLAAIQHNTWEARSESFINRFIKILECA